MGATRFIVMLGVSAGCLPPPQQQPQPQYVQPQYQLPAPQPKPPPQPVATAPIEPQPSAPPPQPQPYPYPPPQPLQPPATYQPPPRPYYGYQPNAPVDSRPTEESHFHDGEVIADLAIVGVLASIDLIVRQNLAGDHGNGVLLITSGGLIAGGGAGYLLTQKFHVTAGVAHSTTIGLMIGVANGALLIQPENYHDGSSVMGLLTIGSIVGTAGGFIYGENAELTNGQSLFIGNMALLGTTTAALTAVTANRDGNYGRFENTTLAIGLDGGTLLGAIIAPHLDWSPKRSKLVFASTFIGAMAGGLIAGTLAQPRNGSTTDVNASLVTGAMTAGLWGGFGLGIYWTRDVAPDASALASRHTQPSIADATTFAPMIGPNGQLGVISGGTF